MSVKKANFKIGDLVCQSNADFLNYLIINRVVGIEYVDEFSDMWLEGYDEEPYYFYETEIVFIKAKNDDFYLEIGDVVSFEEEDLVPVLEYLNKEVTIDDYIKYYCENNF